MSTHSGSAGADEPVAYPGGRLRVAVTGASGLIGTALCERLVAAGHEVTRLVRDRAQSGVFWEPSKGQIDSEALQGVDALVHLAGENVGAGRWTQERRKRILESRRQGTRLISETLAQLSTRGGPKVLLSASAVGLYGDRGAAWLSEDSGAGEDFLAQVCVAWESAAEPARQAGLRVVHPRIGLVLAQRGGLLERMVPLFRLNLGGRLGNGAQFMSWITLRDMSRALEHLLMQSAFDGPVNVCAPEPATNADFTRALAGALGRVAPLPVPALALKLALGDFAQSALSSQRASAARLRESGFEFEDAELGPALRSLVG